MYAERIAVIEAQLKHIVRAIEMLSDAVDTLGYRTQTDPERGSDIETPGLLSDNMEWPTI